jgi:hypothetical protein
VIMQQAQIDPGSDLLEVSQRSKKASSRRLIGTGM